MSYRRNDYKPIFNMQEKEFINSLIPGLDFDNLSGDDYHLIYDKTGTEYGFVCQDDPIQDLDKCYLCESILDKYIGWKIYWEKYDGNSKSNDKE